MCLGKEYGGMGFWNLHHFNLAMLGQQVWRILFDPNAFLSRVIKAKYFAQGDLLHATKGSNLSLLWKNLLQF